MIQGKPAPLKKIGSVTVIDAETGEVVAEKPNAMTLLPAPSGVCAECAVDHPHTEPHDQQSLLYQMRFHSMHGRWPTWSDAMAHCTPEVQTHWRTRLLELLKSHDLPVPEELLHPKAVGR